MFPGFLNAFIVGRKLAESRGVTDVAEQNRIGAIAGAVGSTPVGLVVAHRLATQAAASAPAPAAAAAPPPPAHGDPFAGSKERVCEAHKEIAETAKRLAEEVNALAERLDKDMERGSELENKLRALQRLEKQMDTLCESLKDGKG